ncbi:hypothetical protein L228DRAFT_117311 [Xylona heveae TC161]|uniref:Uncharacterized protein n=1 Tax=Xylona heveae (strain CBS 132557 / TC161) TaxID=1328760 RepID=A0A165HGS9_XYLHT|nr:hypothetical protein L228DRAFT_117311 [Xylona heveae TC161]KZF23491.1 hypothetical protein L228DRAFT_117311 [Xylona heveae TC161]
MNFCYMDPLDHEFSPPSALLPETPNIDDLSISLRGSFHRLTNLVRVELGGLIAISPALFWPQIEKTSETRNPENEVSGPVPFWPNLQLLDITFSLVAPNGEWYFEHDLDRVYTAQEFGIDEEGIEEGVFVDPAEFHMLNDADDFVQGIENLQPIGNAGGAENNVADNDPQNMHEMNGMQVMETAGYYDEQLEEEIIGNRPVFVSRFRPIPERINPLLIALAKASSPSCMPSLQFLRLEASTYRRYGGFEPSDFEVVFRRKTVPPMELDLEFWKFQLDRHVEKVWRETAMCGTGNISERINPRY